MPSDQLFTSLAELQGYDCVVLANVPRASGGETDNKEATNFTDEQIAMLVRNTEQFGCGLVMIGGDRSFGAGGWTNTELEKAMPVDFQIKNAKVKAVGALVMMMHASEIAQGNYWQKVIGAEALKVLGPSDYCGCLHWDDFTGGDNWLWRDAANGKGLAQRRRTGRRSGWASIDRMQPGDMPAVRAGDEDGPQGVHPEPGLDQAHDHHQRRRSVAAQRHDPRASTRRTASRFRPCAVGSHGPAESTLLQRHRHRHRRQVLRGHQPQGPAADLPDRGPPRRPPAGEGRPQGHPADRRPTRRTRCSQNIGEGVPPVTGFVLTHEEGEPAGRSAGAGQRASTPRTARSSPPGRYGAGKTVAFTTDAGRTLGQRLDRLGRTTTSSSAR